MNEVLIRGCVVAVLALFARAPSPASAASTAISTTAADAGVASRDEARRIVIQEAMRSRLVSPALALAVAEVESDFRADVESKAGARGVMQLMPRTARGEFGVRASDLWEPRLNVQLGIAFLDDLLDRYDGRLDIALSHYNGGSRVGKPGAYRVIPATKAYVRRVMRLYRHNRTDAKVRHLVRREGEANPALKLEFASRNRGADDQASGDWRHYLELASSALEEADRNADGNQSGRSGKPSSAEALIRLIESTKSRFRKHLGARAG